MTAPLPAMSLAALLAAQVPPPAPLPAEMLARVGIDQKLDAQVPLDAVFRDETGAPVRLGACFGRRPVVLAFVYYRCPMLCTMTLNGMLAAFKVLSFEVGREFEVVTVSIDPREGPPLAAEKKRSYLEQYGRVGAGEGWRFLTGGEESIASLSRAAGFRYHYDAATDQYAHGSGIMVLTPDGRLSRYLLGIEYSARDLKLALMEASRGRVGSLADRVLLLCYRYDPASGRYGLAIMTALRIGAVLTLLALGGFVARSVRGERRRRSAPAGRAPAAAPGEVP